jgi:hypothetical protein
MYRIKDSATGKYMNTGTYSYSSLVWTKRGRTYREIHHIKTSMHGRKTQFYEWLHKYEIINIDNYGRNQYLREHTPKTWDFLPETVVIEHYYTKEIVSTLKDVLL